MGPCMQKVEHNSVFNSVLCEHTQQCALVATPNYCIRKTAESKLLEAVVTLSVIPAVFGSVSPFSH